METGKDQTVKIREYLYRDASIYLQRKRDSFYNIEECIKLAENFGMAVRGKDAPIHILSKPKRRSIE